MNRGDVYKVIKSTFYYNKGDILTVDKFLEEDNDYYSVKFEEIEDYFRLPNTNMVLYNREHKLKKLLDG